MSLAWFVAPYKMREDTVRHVRYCSMDDYTSQIFADKGNWSETEVLGNFALVKVRASDATLTLINQDADIVRIPKHFDLDDTLGDLTTAQRNAIKNKIIEMGYTTTDIASVLPTNWQNVTLRQVLKFCAQKRFKPRWDEDSKQVVLDGEVHPCRPIEEVDKEIQE